MRSPKKENSSSTGTKWGGGLTSEQLLIGICVFLVVALVCFVAGVWVGRHDRSYQPGPVAESRQGSDAPVSAPLPKPKDRDGSNGEGVQKYPRPVQMPTLQTKPDGGETRVVEHPAPAKKEEGKSEAPLPPKAQPVTPPLDEPVAPKEDKVPEEEKVPEEKPEPLPQTTETQKEENLLEPVGKPVAAPSKRGGFAVQAASFSGPNRVQLAEDLKKKLEKELKLGAELVRSEDDTFVRVLIGDYPDHDAAMKACNELKKRPDLAGCFVKAWN